MTRIICMLALALFGMAPVVRSQPRGRTPAPRPNEDLQQIIEARQRDWSQANAVLLEASRRLNSCSPRLASLLTEVRDSAAALAQANLRYFKLLAANEQREMEADRKFAVDAAGLEELQTAAEIFERDRRFVDAKRKQAGQTGVADIDAALEKLAATVRDGEQAPGGKESAGTARQMRENVANKEALLRQLETSTTAELKLWDAYYTGIEAGIRRQCAESQPGAAKPGPAARPKR